MNLLFKQGIKISLAILINCSVLISQAGFLHNVDGEIVEIPFRPSVNPNAREIAKEDGRDAAY